MCQIVCNLLRVAAFELDGINDHPAVFCGVAPIKEALICVVGVSENAVMGCVCM